MHEKKVVITTCKGKQTNTQTQNKRNKRISNVLNSLRAQVFILALSLLRP